MDQISILENKCQLLYESINEREINEAQETILNLANRPDCLNTCQILLERASSPYAQLIATKTLTKLLDRRDLALTTNDRLSIRTYALNYIVQRQSSLSDFVTNSLMQLYSKLTKLGWFDYNEEHDLWPFRDVIEKMQQLLETGRGEMALIAIKLLSTLVLEVSETNEIEGCRSLAQYRKSINAFRESALIGAFRIASQLLKDAVVNLSGITRADQDHAILLQHILTLYHACLSFDFVGNAPDDSGEEMNSVQLPNTWKSHFETHEAVDILFSIYQTQISELVVQSLDCLVLIASIRRSFFNNEERSNFLEHLVLGTLAVMERPTVLYNNMDCFHNFCRLASRLKTNYQLTELVKASRYADCIRLLVQFTVQALENQIDGSGSTFINGASTSSESNRVKNNSISKSPNSINCRIEKSGNLNEFRTSIPFGNESPTNSVHYLLGLWQRLVSSMPYIRSNEPHYLEQLMPQVLRAYIHSRLSQIPDLVDSSMEINNSTGATSNTSGVIASPTSSVNFNSLLTNGRGMSVFGSQLLLLANSPGEEEEDEMFQINNISHQLEQMSIISRANYDASVQMLVELYQTSAAEFQELLVQRDLLDSDNLHMIRRLCTLMYQLSWLVYLIGALLTGRSNFTNSEEHDFMDGYMSAQVIGLIQLSDWPWTNSHSRFIVLATPNNAPDHPLNNLAGSTPRLSHMAVLRARRRLELALLSFMDYFRKIYIGDVAVRSNRVYHKLSELLGITDETILLQVFINKIAHNIKFWCDCEPVLSRSLALLNEFSISHSSLNKLCKLDTVNFLLFNHNAQYFPFLGVPPNICHVLSYQYYDKTHLALMRYRTNFYTALGRIFLMEFNDDEAKFYAFMNPLSQNFERITNLFLENPGSVQNLVGTPGKIESMKLTLIGLCRDLRGLAQSFTNKNAFLLLFDWFYPSYATVLISVLSNWSEELPLVLPILRLFLEMARNRSNRLSFDAVSPNGLLLFRETSHVLICFGTQLLSRSMLEHPQRHNAIATCFSLLNVALIGGYAHFGTFALYGDNVLEVAVQIFFKLVFSLSKADLILYPKLSLEYFSLVETLCSTDIMFVSLLSLDALEYLFSTLNEGINSLNNVISTNSCNALDNLLTHMFNLYAKTVPSHKIGAPLFPTHSTLSQDSTTNSSDNSKLLSASSANINSSDKLVVGNSTLMYLSTCDSQQNNSIVSSNNGKVTPSVATSGNSTTNVNTINGDTTHNQQPRRDQLRNATDFASPLFPRQSTQTLQQTNTSTLSPDSTHHQILKISQESRQLALFRRRQILELIATDRLNLLGLQSNLTGLDSAGSVTSNSLLNGANSAGNLNNQASLGLDMRMACNLLRLWQKQAEADDLLIQLLTNRPSILQQITQNLLQTLMYDECRTQWVMAKPFFCLYLLLQDFFQTLQEQSVISNPTQYRENMRSCFNRLGEGINLSLSARDRDKFAQNVSTFKREMNQCIRPGFGSSTAADSNSVIVRNVVDMMG